MKLFTGMPKEEMTPEELNDYLIQISKALLEITMKMNLIEKKIKALKA